jgi:hypothetical protein
MSLLSSLQSDQNSSKQRITKDPSIRSTRDKNSVAGSSMLLDDTTTGTVGNKVCCNERAKLVDNPAGGGDGDKLD